jgi:hypothetical protein
MSLLILVLKAIAYPFVGARAACREWDEMDEFEARETGVRR